MRHALCPGSFDPVTLGHIDIFRRTAAMFDRVTVLALQNEAKTPLFSLEERCALIRTALSDLPNVTVDSYSGLTTDYARQHQADVIIKGVRNSSDFLYETEMAAINRSLGAPDTCLLPAQPQLAHISTSMALALLDAGADVRAFFPEHVIQALQTRRYHR